MENACLLIVDVQNQVIAEGPHNEREFISILKRLITACREKGVEVIYVQHCGREGTAMEPAAEGWQIYGEIAPSENEKIVQKRFNSAFRQTELKEYLDEKGLRTIILAGMVTEYCIDVACKVAFEYGYDVIVPHKGTATFDNAGIPAEKLLSFFEDHIWNNRYARVLAVDEILELIQ